MAEADTQRLEGAVTGAAGIRIAIRVMTRMRTHTAVMAVMVAKSTIISVHMRSPLGVLNARFQLERNPDWLAPVGIFREETERRNRRL
jgi:3-polyprenyl-4-hydroxybenzoate decarboxylase